MTITIDELVVADPADAWIGAGFGVDRDACRVGTIGIRLVGRGHGTGIVGWSLNGLAPGGALPDLDGVPLTAPGDALKTVSHPNGVTGIDHVVLLSPNLGRAVTALAAIGLHPRRKRDGELGGRPIQQIFFRLGDVILEVVGSPDAAGEGPSTLWGITFVVTDVDATAAHYGDRISPVKDAVQPGRRIATLRHRACGTTVRTAFISASR